jgi:hypothetical protein
MKHPDFGLPKNLSDLPFIGPELLGWEEEGDDSVLDAELGRVEDSMLALLYTLPDVERIRVFLDAIKPPSMGRLRKSLWRDMARAANRPDKEVVNLPDTDKARLFCRTLARLEGRTASMVMAGAITECYVPAAKRLIAQLDGPIERAWEHFQSVRQEVPDCLWESVFEMIERGDQLNSRQTAALRAIGARIESPPVKSMLPFSVGEAPELTPLERHLLDLHAKDPALAKPLIAGLAQINPERPENWLLFGLTGAVEGRAPGMAGRAWQLAAEIYRWGDVLDTVDKPFDAARLKANADVIRAIFTDSQLASARKLAGEYILRQLLLIGERSLAVELVSPEMFRQYSTILRPVILAEAYARIAEKDVETIRAMAAKFPELRAHGLLAMALRRSGQLQAAQGELRSCAVEAGERMLLEAGITDAYELVIPEKPEEQTQFLRRLQSVELSRGDLHPEVCYCKALCNLVCNDRALAADAYGELIMLSDRHLGVRAYRFLAALLSQAPESVSEELDNVLEADPEEILAFLPMNLLKSGIRALPLVAIPGDLNLLTRFFYEHIPDLLDPLLGHEELLSANPALLMRLLDKNDALADPIQRWAGYQRVIQLADEAQTPELMARAIEGCLSIKDPLLAPYQATLLQEQITRGADSDLKEELVERLTPLNPEQAKAYLYELLHAYLGNKRHEDAWRMVEALRELNEKSADLDQCVGVLRACFEPMAAARRTEGKLPFPVSVGFYGGDETDKLRTDQLREQLMREHPGLTVQFEHNTWNMKNWASLVSSVDKFDVVCASNLMRTDISRGIRRRARESGKIFGFCRNRGLGTISDTIMKAVEMHVARKNR